MAIIYNNRICVYASELIAFNPKSNVGSRDGFMAEGTYYGKVKNGQLEVARRGGRGSSALIYFDTMDEQTRRTYVNIKGDPTRSIDTRIPGLLERYMEYNNDAYEFFSTYKDATDKNLPPEVVNKYILQARVLDAVLKLAQEKQTRVGDGSRFNVWDRLSCLCNELATLKDRDGSPMYPHGLPSQGSTLKRKAEQYRDGGFEALVSKKYGNRNARLVKNEETESVMFKLISQHMNLNNAQIMEQYNEIMKVLGEPLITSPATVENYKKQYESTTIGHRRGAAVLRNTLEMQIKREPPKTAMTYWTLDGWDVELVYKRQEMNSRLIEGEEKWTKRTTYCNRKCIVVVLDACAKYPIGYAVGNHESPALIRKALRNAIRHAKELFGARYKPIQMQSDNYQKKVMVPFYEAMTKYYTPAALGNAKSKIIEPYFNYLNKTYCQLEKNWSGVNINSKRESQPNMEIINRNRHLIPDEDGVLEQIDRIMAKDREKRLPALMKAWENTPQDRKLPFSDEDYLMLMGETTGKTNHLTGRGLMIEMFGERICYETFNMELRNHYNEDWIVRFDPEDMSQVLISNAETTPSRKVKKEIGTLRFMMQREMKIPMALIDQKPEHFEHRRKVEEFNTEFERRYIAEHEKHDAVIEGIVERYAALKTNSLLERALIIDSRGQHKDRRYEERERLKSDADDVEPIRTDEVRHRAPVVTDDDDDDYEWSATDMSFSR